jgi:hypothetical protein
MHGSQRVGFLRGYAVVAARPESGFAFRRLKLYSRVSISTCSKCGCLRAPSPPGGSPQGRVVHFCFVPRTSSPEVPTLVYACDTNLLVGVQI